MAAASAPHAQSALTPPSSSHGGPNSWKSSGPSQTNSSAQSKTNEFPSNRQPLTLHTNGNSLGHQTSRPELSKETDTQGSSRSTESGYLAPANIQLNRKGSSSLSENGSANDSLLDLYGTNRGKNSMENGDRGVKNQGDDDDDDPGWIHRDKLARIESQELQAAGIVLPRARGNSKSSRRERSRDQAGKEVRSEGQKRQRIRDVPVEEEVEERMQWDLRMPEEAAEDPRNGYRDVSAGSKGLSRIPVSKTSPLPIPADYLERDTPISRKQTSGGGDDDSITYPKSRGRSLSMKEEAVATPTPAKRFVSENSTSPTKNGPAARKGSTPSARPKTRSGPRDPSSQQRPQTRSGEPGKIQRPEGDPPWLESTYKPDPRLPPDQQLLPTVAKRLQQEQWEKEGRFGTTYDTDFRPLSGEFDKSYNSSRKRQSEIIKQEIEIPPPKQEEGWPLRTPNTPALSTGRPGTATGSYSTIPKVSEQRSPTLAPPSRPEPVRVQEPPQETLDEEEGKKKLCGCCVVM